jgi:hypothetical protein
LAAGVVLVVAGAELFFDGLRPGPPDPGQAETLIASGSSKRHPRWRANPIGRVCRKKREKGRAVTDLA